MVVTEEEKLLNLKEVIDNAVKGFEFVKHIIILERTKNKISLML